MLDRENAECVKRGIPVEVFIHDPEDADHEEKLALGKSACDNCAVRAECHALAFLSRKDTAGLFGGEWFDVTEE